MTWHLPGRRLCRMPWLMSSVWTGALCLALAAWLAAAELSRHDGLEALARAQRDSGNLTQIIAEQAARAISDTDRILNFLAYDLGRLGNDRPSLSDVLKNATSGSDLLLQLSYTDATGDLIGTSVDGSPSRVNLADREHFRVHRDGTVPGLFISIPVFGRASGKWSIQLSRRIARPDGSFAGIMVASLDPFYFSRTFNDLDVGRRGLVAMFGRDGILRARTGLDSTNIGHDVSGTLPFRAAQTEAHGFLRDVSPFDGVARLLSFRGVPGYPMVVLVGFEEAEFLAAAQGRRNVYEAGAGAATAMLLVMALLVSWQMRVQVRARAVAEHANRMKSDFLTTMSHEIRTPMNGVLGMLALLEGGELAPEQRSQVATARQSAEGLLALLDDILDYSKLEAGRSVAAPENCNPAAIATAVLELLQPNAAGKGLTLALQIGSAVPDVVVTDPTRLRQILFNLVGNAIKFTQAGHVLVRAQRGAMLTDGRFLLEFEVEDTGIGIQPQVIPTLFRQFVQADGSISRTYGGSGLGLAISKRLCELQGGSISVCSAPGKGSVFRFSVGAAVADTVPPSAAVATAECRAVAPALAPRRILVVDDNAVNRQVVAGLLRRCGHHITTADSGPAAIAALQAPGTKRFDLVLMDVQMPVMDGLTATRLIRGLPSPFDRTPVVALTAHASGSSRADCLAAGMDGFVSKPVRIDAMIAELTRVLGGTAAPSIETNSLRAEAGLSPSPEADPIRIAAVAAEVFPSGEVARPCEGPALGQALPSQEAPPPGEPSPADDEAWGALLDMAQVEELAAAFSPESWEELLAVFAHSARTEIDRIVAALAAGESLRRPAHTLKGLAWNAGALRLGNLAKRLETATADEAIRLVSELRPLLGQSITALAALTPTCIAR